jgi:hypothetical protein
MLSRLSMERFTVEDIKLTRKSLADSVSVRVELGVGRLESVAAGAANVDLQD